MAEIKSEKPDEAREQLAEPVVPPSKNNNKPLIIAIVASVVLGIALIAAVGALTLSALSHSTGKMRNSMQAERTMRPESGMNGPMGDQRRSSRSETGPLADSSTRVNGVVTAINGDSITIAGNGKQVTIKRTSSTTVRGTNTTVAVNDTISAIGTTSNDVFTASTITIRNITSN